MHPASWLCNVCAHLLRGPFLHVFHIVIDNSTFLSVHIIHTNASFVVVFVCGSCLSVLCQVLTDEMFKTRDRLAF